MLNDNEGLGNFQMTPFFLIYIYIIKVILQFYKFYTDKVHFTHLPYYLTPNFNEISDIINFLKFNIRNWEFFNFRKVIETVMKIQKGLS